MGVFTANGAFLMQSGPDGGINKANLLSGMSAINGSYGLGKTYGFKLFANTIVPNGFVPISASIQTGPQWSSFESSKAYLENLDDRWNAQNNPYSVGSSNCNDFSSWATGQLTGGK